MPRETDFLFMGLLDESVGLNLQSLKFAADTKEETYLDHQGRYQGIAYYAVDLSSAKELTENLINFVNDSINKLHDNPNGTLILMGYFSLIHVNIILDLNKRSKFIFSRSNVIFLVEYK